VMGKSQITDLYTKTFKSLCQITNQISNHNPKSETICSRVSNQTKSQFWSNLKLRNYTTFVMWQHGAPDFLKSDLKWHKTQIISVSWEFLANWLYMSVKIVEHCLWLLSAHIHYFTVWNIPPPSKVVLHVKTQKNHKIFNQLMFNWRYAELVPHPVVTAARV